MTYRSHDRREAEAYAEADRRNGVSNVRTYIESLQRPRTGTYVVLPDGTVSFVR